MTLEPGDLFTAEIQSITSNHLGTVRVDDELINIGPVSCNKGDEVQLRYLGQKEEYGNDVGFALCLAEEILGPNYTKWVKGMRGLLITDDPPNVGEVTYVEIDEIDDRGLGVAVFGEQKIHLGPIRSEVGDLVRIVGIGDNCAEVRTESVRGDNYMSRLHILAKQYHKVPVSKGDEITTTISDIDGDNLIGYVGDVPVRFPGDSAEVAQKIDGKIIGYDRDMVLGEVVKTYDEPGRIEHASHWARMQWLKDSGFGKNPLRSFARKFTGAPDDALPDRDDQIRDVLIAEAVRLGLDDKTSETGDKYPQAHISGLRHWVVHKLSAVLGDPSDDESEDWFRDVMSERKGPTITFYGDLLSLAGGYYAPAPTRAIMTTEGEAVLISGKPTRAFLDTGLDVEYRGITRIIKNTSESELASNNIPQQPRSGYVGTDDTDLLTENDLATFIETHNHEEWGPEIEWEAYTGQQYGFVQDEDPLIVSVGENKVSFWRIPVEYGSDAYQLKIEGSGEKRAHSINVPVRYDKQIRLLIDSISGVPQQVDINRDGDVAILNCDFAPPRPQMRWLHATGAQWIDSPQRKLQWKIDPETIDSVVAEFEKLPVSITNNARSES